MVSRDGRWSGLAPSLRDVFERESVPVTRTRYEAEQLIYAAGEEHDALYWIESGQVKIYTSSASGRDCLLAIYTTGEMFGESTLHEPRHRLESASAMLPSVIRRLARRDFLEEVRRSGLEGPLIRHLAARMVDRQEAVVDLVTLGSEQRLGKVLLQLGDRLGSPDGAWLHIEQRISQEDLAQIVGTTRPRVTAFMQKFRRLGFIDTPGPRSIRIHRERTRSYLGE